jgi:hypothetical protein
MVSPRPRGIDAEMKSIAAHRSGFIWDHPTFFKETISLKMGRVLPKAENINALIVKKKGLLSTGGQTVGTLHIRISQKIRDHLQSPFTCWCMRRLSTFFKKKGKTALTWAALI